MSEWKQGAGVERRGAKAESIFNATEVKNWFLLLSVALDLQLLLVNES